MYLHRECNGDDDDVDILTNSGGSSLLSPAPLYPSHGHTYVRIAADGAMCAFDDTKDHKGSRTKEVGFSEPIPIDTGYGTCNDAVIIATEAKTEAARTRSHSATPYSDESIKVPIAGDEESKMLITKENTDTRVQWRTDDEEENKLCSLPAADFGDVSARTSITSISDISEMVARSQYSIRRGDDEPRSSISALPSINPLDSANGWFYLSMRN